MLQFNLAKLKDQSKLITSEDDRFIGTSLEGQGFSIEVKRLNRTEKANVLADLQSSVIDRDITMADYNRALFMASVSNIDGVDVTDGVRPLSDEELSSNNINKTELIYEYGADILVNAIVGIIDGFSREEAEKKSDSNLGQTDTQTGM